MSDLSETYFNMVLDHGHAIQCVAPGTYPNQRQGFAYTVGRTMLGRPELIISGPFAEDHFGEILNAAVARDDASPFVHGVPQHDLAAIPMVFPIDTPHAPIDGAWLMFGQATAMQLLWPDDNGRFPGEELYHLDPALQEVLT